MANWGISDQTGFTTTNYLGQTRCVTGTFNPGGDATLDSFAVWNNGSGTLSHRWAVYQGGDSATQIKNATLIWDSGEIVTPYTSVGWVTVTADGSTLTDNTRLWIVGKAQGGGSPFGPYIAYHTDTGKVTDFDTTSSGYFAPSGHTNGSDPTLAFPATMDNTNTPSAQAYWICAYFSYTLIPASGGQVVVSAFSDIQ